MNTVKVRNLELGNGIPAICIPNVGKTKEDILSLTRTYLDMHMDLMEWRMDWYEDVEDIAKVTELVKELRNVMGDTPLLCTFRTDKEGGVHPMSTEKYAKLNKAVAATGNADIVDVEIFTGDDIVREMIDAIHASGTKVIASNHDFDKTPAKSDLLYRLRKMQDMGADIPKMAVMPQTKKDVLTLLSVTEEMASDYADSGFPEMHKGSHQSSNSCDNGEQRTQRNAQRPRYSPDATLHSREKGGQFGHCGKDRSHAGDGLSQCDQHRSQSSSHQCNLCNGFFGLWV